MQQSVCNKKLNFKRVQSFSVQNSFGQEDKIIEHFDKNPKDETTPKNGSKRNSPDFETGQQTPQARAQMQFFSEKKKVDPQLKKHTKALLNSMMKMSEKGSQKGTNMSILSAREILKELDKRSQSQKSSESDNRSNASKTKRRPPMKKTLSLFSCHLVQEESGALNLSSLKNVNINKNEIQNVQLCMSGKRTVEMDLNFGNIEPPKSKFQSSSQVIVSNNLEKGDSKFFELKDQISDEGSDWNSDSVSSKKESVEEKKQAYPISESSMSDSCSESAHSRMSMILACQNQTNVPIQQRSHKIKQFTSQFKNLDDEQKSFDPEQSNLQNNQEAEPLPPGHQAGRLEIIMQLCQNNPFGRHIFVMDDIDNEEDHQRFLSHMKAMSQEATYECSGSVDQSPQNIFTGQNDSAGANFVSDVQKDLEGQANATFAFKSNLVMQSQPLQNNQHQNVVFEEFEENKEMEDTNSGIKN